MFKKAKKPAVAKATQLPAFEITEQMVRDRAQKIYEITNRHDAVANWIQAEKELGLGSK
jgi:hypothetical protein